MTISASRGRRWRSSQRHPPSSFPLPDAAYSSLTEPADTPSETAGPARTIVNRVLSRYQRPECAMIHAMFSQTSRVRAARDCLSRQPRQTTGHHSRRSPTRRERRKDIWPKFYAASPWANSSFTSAARKAAPCWLALPGRSSVYDVIQAVDPIQRITTCPLGIKRTRHQLMPAASPARSGDRDGREDAFK